MPGGHTPTHKRPTQDSQAQRPASAHRSRHGPTPKPPSPQQEGGAAKLREVSPSWVCLTLVKSVSRQGLFKYRSIVEMADGEKMERVYQVEEVQRGASNLLFNATQPQGAWKLASLVGPASVSKTTGAVVPPPNAYTWFNLYLETPHPNHSCHLQTHGRCQTTRLPKNITSTRHLISRFPPIVPQPTTTLLGWQKQVQIPCLIFSA